MREKQTPPALPDETLLRARLHSLDQLVPTRPALAEIVPKHGQLSGRRMGVSSRLGPILGIGLAGAMVIAIAVTTLRFGNRSPIGEPSSGSPFTSIADSTPSSTAASIPPASSSPTPASTPPSASATPFVTPHPTRFSDGVLALTRLAGSWGVEWAPDSKTVAILDLSSPSENDVIRLFDSNGRYLEAIYGYGFVWLDATHYVLTRGIGSGQIVAHVGELGKQDQTQIDGKYMFMTGAGQGRVALTLASGGYVVFGPEGLSQVRIGFPLAWSPEGNLIAVWGATGVEIVKSSDGTIVTSFPSVPIYDHTIVYFSPDSKHLAIEYGDLRIADIATGKVRTIATEDIFDVAWLTNESLLVQRIGSAHLSRVTTEGVETQDASGPIVMDGHFATAPSNQAVAGVHGTTLELAIGPGAPVVRSLPGSTGIPLWSPDGTRLVVVCLNADSLDVSPPEVVLVTP